ncbi:archaemetzincin [Desulfosarcina cetonica]|uniref:archaemetzincin n=1 Tax=Desulfosarcina cetonica TaxID=90730 RepID=UPI0006D09615|nr:archaemetzincin [Desulfosarcina cetonica]
MIAAHISGYLNMTAEILPAMPLPPQALDGGRLQYNAALLIDALEKADRIDAFKIIALFDVDLFTPLFTHVFGEARQNGRVAVISLYRLATPTDGMCPPSGHVLERVAKIALHELGHLLNLLHCADPHCLMHFSDTPDRLDRTPLNFCRYCRRSLHRSLAAWS